MSHHASGSRWHLLVGALSKEGCLYWAREDVELPPDAPGQAAQIGTCAHKRVSNRIRGFGPTPITNDLEMEAQAHAHQAWEWLKQNGQPTVDEAAIVIDTATGTARLIEGKGHREYGSLKSSEIPTTLDWIWLNEGAPVRVRDYKTGKKENAHVEQLHLQGLAAATFYGRTSAEIGFGFSRKTKFVPDPLVLMTEADLEVEMLRASAVMRMLPTSKPQPGQWCWSCPLGKANCPAWALGPHAPMERESA